MTAFEWDCIQKKRIARGAKNKVGRRSGCDLPHDNMTRKEWEKMNGEVITVNLNEPITWETWKALPKRMQEEYYNHLADTYGVGREQIAKMMGCSSEAVRLYAQKNGLDLRARKRGERVPPEKMFRWRVFCATTEDAAQAVIDEVVNGSLAAMNDLLPAGGLNGFTLTFAPHTEWAEVMQIVQNLPLPDGATIRVVVE